MKSLVFALFVLCAVVSAYPTISETFYAKITVTVNTPFGNGTGFGVWAEDWDKQVSIEEYSFDNNTFDQYSLNRYDLGELYRIFPTNKTSCELFKVKDSMPETWNWLMSTKFIGNETFNDESVDVWESTHGYLVRRLAVLSSNTSVPVWLYKSGNSKVSTYVFTSYNDSAPAFALFSVPTMCEKPESPKVPNLVGCMASAAILANAEIWVQADVPYNQEGTYMNYREDCSGYVSFCWQAGPPGLDTSDFYQQAFPISKAELQAGDCMLNAGDHVVLFGGWVDDNQTYYEAYEETQPCSDNPNWCNTMKHSCLYPYYYDGSDFLPYRFNNFCGTSTATGTTATSYGEDFDTSLLGGKGSIPDLEEQAQQFKF